MLACYTDTGDMALNDLKAKFEDESYEEMTPAQRNIRFLPLPPHVPEGIYSNDDVDNNSIGGFESNTYERISFRNGKNVLTRFSVEQTEEQVKNNDGDPSLSLTNPSPMDVETPNNPTIITSSAETCELNDASTPTLSMSEADVVTMGKTAQEAGQNDAAITTPKGEHAEDEEEMDSDMPIYAKCQKPAAKTPERNPTKT